MPLSQFQDHEDRQDEQKRIHCQIQVDEVIASSQQADREIIHRMDQGRNEKRKDRIESVSFDFTQTVEIAHDHSEGEMERRQCTEDCSSDTVGGILDVFKDLEADRYDRKAQYGILPGNHDAFFSHDTFCADEFEEFFREADQDECPYKSDQSVRRSQRFGRIGDILDDLDSILGSCHEFQLLRADLNEQNDESADNGYDRGEEHGDHTGDQEFHECESWERIELFHPQDPDQKSHGYRNG